ncbi:MAG: hypothetical protein K0B10_01300 [Vicingaceae bacterium]|nr:hypothetical protein [Vicingaceae bacterium]
MSDDFEFKEKTLKYIEHWVYDPAQNYTVLKFDLYLNEEWCSDDETNKTMRWRVTGGEHMKHGKLERLIEHDFEDISKKLNTYDNEDYIVDTVDVETAIKIRDEYIQKIRSNPTCKVRKIFLPAGLSDKNGKIISYYYKRFLVYEIDEDKIIHFLNSGNAYSISTTPFEIMKLQYEFNSSLCELDEEEKEEMEYKVGFEEFIKSLPPTVAETYFKEDVHSEDIHLTLTSKIIFNEYLAKIGMVTDKFGNWKLFFSYSIIPLSNN